MTAWYPPRRRYAALVDRPDSEIPLEEAAACIALIGHPELAIASVLERLDEIAEQAAARAATDASPWARRAALERVLYAELGFRGNDEDYYDPRNSFLNEVLERRLGIPITLSLIYIAVGRRLGLELDGIGFPGHFLVRLHGPGNELTLIDAYANGRTLEERDLRVLLERVAGRELPIHGEFLNPSSARDVLARMLGNLRAIYAGRGDAMKTLEVMEWLVLTRPETVELKRDRGLLYFRLGSMSAAAHDLRAYLRGDPGAEDRAAIEQIVHKAERAVANVN